MVEELLRPHQMWIPVMVFCLAPLGGTATSAQPAAVGPVNRPNVILFLADDLGYRDLSCFGGEAVQTPNLDQLASEGIKLVNFYSASAVCSPTRASILTGNYPLTWGITRHFNDVDMWLPQRAHTLAEGLQQLGYTTIHVGKWHLGGLHVDQNGDRLTDQPGPRQHGFDFYQTQIEQQPLRGKMGEERTLYRNGGTVLLRNDRVVPKGDPYYQKHLTDANADYAIEMIKACAASGQPFFLNLWWLVPHTPYEPAPEPNWSATASDQISDDQHRFRSMVKHMDANTGKILAVLNELSIANDTLVVFTSDNGAAYEGHIGNLKGGKTDLHEGGIKVPFIARWPGRTREGASSGFLANTIDLMPTILSAVDADPDAFKQCEGIDLMPVLAGQDESRLPVRGSLFWQLDIYRGLQRHYPKPKPFASEVVRRDNWKLLARKGEPLELFDLIKDPGEENNLLTQYPKLAESMSRELRAWLLEKAPNQSTTEAQTGGDDEL